MRLLCVFAVLGTACFSAFAEDEQTSSAEFNITEFGAVGDGTTDNTEAFQRALDAAGKSGGIVQVPHGKFLLNGTLSVPADVTIEGTWRAPARHKDSQGSTLLVTAGKGEADGTPFLSMHECSMLKGLLIHYPEQVNENPPIPYPWTIRGRGDNITILDTLITNPYQGVDFGTFPCGRHSINKLYMQALLKGIFVDKCFDVGRIENAHIWPFWSTEGPVRQFSREKGTAFIFGRTDWEYITNNFCIGYATGFLFTSFQDGPGNVLVTQSGSDIGPLAVRVVDVQGHSGVTFSNCQIMAGVKVEDSNTGPVKFTGCGFWPIESTTFQAELAGEGHCFFEACHFANWDRKHDGTACIIANAAGLTVNGCDFMAEGKTQIFLGPAVDAAVITGNRFRGGIAISDKTEEEADVQIGLNAGK